MVGHLVPQLLRVIICRNLAISWRLLTFHRTRATIPVCRRYDRESAKSKREQIIASHRLHHHSPLFFCCGTEERSAQQINSGFSVPLAKMRGFVTSTVCNHTRGSVPFISSSHRFHVYAKRCLSRLLFS